VSPTLDAIVAQALAKKPEDRYQTAGELQSALELWLADNRTLVNAGNVAEMMEDLYESEIQRGPLVDTNPFGSSFQSLTANRPAPEHSSGSMSAAQPLSHPSLLSAVAGDHPPPLEKKAENKGLKYAVVAVAVLLGFGAAMFGVDSFLADEGDSGQATAEDAHEPDASASTEEVADAAVTVVEEEGEVDSGTEAVAALEPTHATIEVTYSPARARVSLDGNRISGGSPLLIDAITPGSHRVTVNAPGFRPFAEELELSAGERVEITATLRPQPREPAAPPGRLSINTRPWSKVYVGPRLLGTTPIAEARVTSGAVRLRLVDRDGRTHTKTVRVPPNGSERVFYDLSR
jgi:serine/threonine-protein kinase